VRYLYDDETLFVPFGDVNKSLVDVEENVSWTLSIPLVRLPLFPPHLNCLLIFITSVINRLKESNLCYYIQMNQCPISPTTVVKPNVKKITIIKRSQNDNRRSRCETIVKQHGMESYI